MLCDGHRGKKEEVAQVEFKLASVISKGNKGLDLDFCELDSGASITDFCSVNVKYVRLGGGNKVEYKIDLKAYEVKDIEQYSKSDPFLKISRPSNRYITETDENNVPKDEWVEVVRTEHKEDDLNPNFKSFFIDGKQLCRGMENTILKMEIWDKGKEGVDSEENTLISTGYFTVYRHLVPRKSIVTYD